MSSNQPGQPGPYLNVDAPQIINPLTAADGLAWERRRVPCRCGNLNSVAGSVMEGAAVCACGAETPFSPCDRCASGLGVKWAGLPGKLCEPCLTDGIDNAIRDFR